MEWIKGWVNQIIVAIIIAVIFELILPEGNHRKYITMVIRLYVLFVMINPLVSKVTNQNFFNTSQWKVEKYFSNTVETGSYLNSEAMIETTFENSLKQDIQNKLKRKGYTLESIDIAINKSHKEDEGAITKLKVTIQKENKTETESQNQLVKDIVISTKQQKEKQNQLRKSQIQEVKKFLSQEYGLEKEKIEVY